MATRSAVASSRARPSFWVSSSERSARREITPYTPSVTATSAEVVRVRRAPMRTAVIMPRKKPGPVGSASAVQRPAVGAAHVVPALEIADDRVADVEVVEHRAGVGASGGEDVHLEHLVP